MSSAVFSPAGFATVIAPAVFVVDSNCVEDSGAKEFDFPAGMLKDA